MTADFRTAEREHLTNLLALCAHSLSILSTSTSASADFEVESQPVCLTTNPIQP